MSSKPAGKISFKQVKKSDGASIKPSAKRARSSNDKTAEEPTLTPPPKRAAPLQPLEPSPANVRLQPAVDAITTDDDLPADERLLRSFDLAAKFGPCIGITRLERYERAQKFGLEPPAAVGQLLSTLGPDHVRNQPLWARRV